MIEPILSKRGETVSVKVAAHLVGRDEKTIRAWGRRFGIGAQVGPRGRLSINRVGLEMVAHGDMLALAKLRAGDRSDPVVARYFEHVGITP
ncbi:hypothetical protein [Prosthecomicrobium pneumaticum]|uniref:DNA-binding protein n=1 Tax=Prosthecomicrobium pneumaticum TaxID=81895 RepID=A0A7W9L3J9_9HYPH|nr:hypothetical protein [Prosthecomicrobium pneumaticum]MBB5754626.1 hypothetical protein [Prosthecomicrobium pneumaticum]